MKIKITNISGLQIFQLIRNMSFVLIGVVLSKSTLGTSAIGEYEQFLFIAGGVSFFWLNGLFRGILPVLKEDGQNRFFSAFIILSIFTLICIFLISILSKSISQAVLASDKIPELGLLALYLFFSVPANLIEYLFLIKNESKKIVGYGLISFAVMILLVAVPAVLGMNVSYCLYGLVASAVLRYAYLWLLILKEVPLFVSSSFIKEHLQLSYPLILSALLSGSAQYVDGFIVTSKYDEATFAVFRYGAREFPLVVLMANAFSNAMLPEFSGSNNIDILLEKIKNESTRLAKYLFPPTLLLVAVSHFIFPKVFNAGFEQSASIFNIYLLLIISRLVFPQTILIGLKETKIIARASFFELVLNVALSLWFVTFWGLEGIAYATVLAYVFEKLYLLLYVKRRLNIFLTKYQNISLHLFYSLLLLIVFYLVEFVIY